MKIERIENIYNLESGNKISYLRHILDDKSFDSIEKLDLDDNLLEYYKMSIDNKSNELKKVLIFRKYLSSYFYSIDLNNLPKGFFYSLNKKNISIAERIQNKDKKEIVDIELYKICSSIYINTDIYLSHLNTYYEMQYNANILQSLSKYFKSKNIEKSFEKMTKILESEQTSKFKLHFGDSPFLYVMTKQRKILES